jgi:hypothetical protein
MKEFEMAEKYYNLADDESNHLWTAQLQFLKLLTDREDLYITINSPDEVGTFANDNKQYLLSFIYNEFKKENMVNDNLDRLIFAVVIRQFTEELTNRNIPKKRVAMCCLKQNGVYPIKAKDALLAATTDFQTGNKIAKEDDVEYIDFKEMLQYLNIPIE